MGDVFTDQGLSDRKRIIARDKDADQYIRKLEVDELVIGGTRIFASQGSRAANGRLTFKGRDGNSIELEAKPADDCSSKGIVAQFIWYAKYYADSFKRFAINIVNDGEGERVEVDSSAHESTYAMPVYLPVVGAKSRSDGTDVPNTAKYSFSYFQDGSHEFHLKNDTLRVEIASFVEAFIANDKSLMIARTKLNDGTWRPLVFDK